MWHGHGLRWCWHLPRSARVHCKGSGAVQPQLETRSVATCVMRAVLQSWTIRQRSGLHTDAKGWRQSGQLRHVGAAVTNVAVALRALTGPWQMTLVSRPPKRHCGAQSLLHLLSPEVAVPATCCICTPFALAVLWPLSVCGCLPMPA